MNAIIHRIILNLNRLLLVQTDRQHSNREALTKPCVRRIGRILNHNLDLFEGIFTESLELTALTHIEAEGLECLIRFYPHQSFSLVYSIGSTLFKASNIVPDLTTRAALLEKANQIFDFIYIHFSQGNYRSDSSFNIQYANTKIALAEALFGLGFEVDAQQLELRAKSILKMPEPVKFVKGMEVIAETTLYNAAA